MKPVQKQTVDRAVADIVPTAAAVHGRTTAGKQVVRMRSERVGFATCRPFNVSFGFYPHAATAEAVSTQSRSNGRSTQEVCQHENRCETRSEPPPTRRGRKRSRNRGIWDGCREVQGGDVFATTRSRTESACNSSRETPTQSDQGDEW